MLLRQITIAKSGWPEIPEMQQSAGCYSYGTRVTGADGSYSKNIWGWSGRKNRIPDPSPFTCSSVISGRMAGLFQWGYIEELGLGIDRMIEEMLEAGHPAPSFEAKPYSFTVRLYNTLERKPTKHWPTNMNERQMRAMSFIEEYGRITNRDYRQLCPDSNPETLRLDLVDLVDKGLLLKIGDKKGTYYILK